MLWGTKDIYTQVANATQMLGEPHSSPAPDGSYPTVLKMAPLMWRQSYLVEY